MILEKLGLKDITIPDEQFINAAKNAKDQSDISTILIWYNIDSFFELLIDLFFLLIFSGLTVFVFFLIFKLMNLIPKFSLFIQLDNNKR
jgi:hypothetical protein